MSNLEHDDINSILFETQNLAHNERVNNSNLVELFPGTDVWVNAQQKTTAILKANGKPSKLVALSLRMLHSTEELANFSLEGQRAKIAYPENEAYAIKVFVLSICQKDRGKPAISNTEFNKLFNRVFAMARSVILPEEEKQRRRMKSLTYMRKKRAKARK